MLYNISLEYLEKQLKKRTEFVYNWNHIKQNNKDDRSTNFIYTSPNFEYIQHKIKTNISDKNLQNYALNRWYNFWSATGVESIFVQNKNIVAEKNVKNKYSDFSIYDKITNKKINFDHKTTVLPRCFNVKILEFLKNNAPKNLQIFDKEIISWLYENQSQEGRRHWKNRFFVILVDAQAGEHWKLKSELLFLNEAISEKLKLFKISDCVEFTHLDEKVYSAVFWIVK